VNVHLRAFEFIQLFANHRLTHPETHHNTNPSAVSATSSEMVSSAHKIVWLTIHS